jgi:hypothetical protein
LIGRVPTSSPEAGPSMPSRVYTAQQAGRRGGLIRAATAPTPQAITQAANDRNWARFVELIRAKLPDLKDEAEIARRAALLRQAHMVELAAKASRARKLRAELRKLDAEIADASPQAAGDAA